MKKPRKRTRRGIKFDALADGYKILKSPLAQTFRATAEHFDETDPPVYEGKRPVETESKQEKIEAVLRRLRRRRSKGDTWFHENS